MKFSETRHFYKLHGAGNDFVLLDNRPGQRPEAVFDGTDHARIARICARHTGVGADGLMLLSESPSADFCLAYYNADGRPGEMCGNGARCAVWLAHHLDIAPSRCTFEVWGERYEAEVLAAQQVRLRMRPPRFLGDDAGLPDLPPENFSDAMWMNTGVPHLVLVARVPLADLDVRHWGRHFRYHPHFAPAGTNVNFIRPGDPGVLQVRVYERGVENETLACGTGAVACGIFAAQKWGWPSPVTVQSPGGRLIIEFSGGFRTIYLNGPVTPVFEGTLAESL